MISMNFPRTNPEVNNLHKTLIKDISPGETLRDWEKSRMRGRSKAGVPI